MISVWCRRTLVSMSEIDPRTDTPLNWSDLGVSELPTGTVTLLLADVEGSTRLWETQPDEMAQAIARLDRALTDLVASHAGVRPVEQGEGDSFVVAFALQSGSHAEAARFFGAADAIRGRMGVVRFKVFDEAHEECVSAVRAALGDHDFDEAWAEGAALTTEEAIAYAQRGHGERKRPAKGWESLTPAERDVVRLVGEGLANKDIAARLFVSPRTVESHLTHVYTKLGLSSRVQLAQEAVRHDP
jgi:DNA-binding CsgD family transcriptional regulator